MFNDELILQLCAELSAVSFLHSSPCPLGNGQQQQHVFWAAWPGRIPHGACPSQQVPLPATCQEEEGQELLGGGQPKNLLHGLVRKARGGARPSVR